MKNACELDFTIKKSYFNLRTIEICMTCDDDNVNYDGDNVTGDDDDTNNIYDDDNDDKDDDYDDTLNNDAEKKNC